MNIGKKENRERKNKCMALSRREEKGWPDNEYDLINPAFFYEHLSKNRKKNPSNYYKEKKVLCFWNKNIVF